MDPKNSFEFYQDILGTKIIYSADFEANMFTHYFLIYVNAQDKYKCLLGQQCVRVSVYTRGIAVTSKIWLQSLI